MNTEQEGNIPVPADINQPRVVLTPPPSPQASKALLKTVKILAQNFSFNKIRIDKKLDNLEQESADNHTKYF